MTHDELREAYKNTQNIEKVIEAANEVRKEMYEEKNG